MNGRQRVWEKVRGTQCRRPVAVREQALVLPLWSALPEEWVLASLIRGSSACHAA